PLSSTIEEAVHVVGTEVEAARHLREFLGENDRDEGDGVAPIFGGTALLDPVHKEVAVVVLERVEQDYNSLVILGAVAEPSDDVVCLELAGVEEDGRAGVDLEDLVKNRLGRQHLVFGVSELVGVTVWSNLANDDRSMQDLAGAHVSDKAVGKVRDAPRVKLVEGDRDEVLGEGRVE